MTGVPDLRPLAVQRPPVALITGGSRGIGAAIAKALGASGCKLALVAEHSEALAATVAELRGQGVEAIGRTGSVSDEAFVSSVMDDAESRLGPLTILVNNAGALEISPIEQLGTSQWDHVLDVNLKGAFLCSREAVRRMKPRGEGRLVAISSISATLGTPHFAAYTASKWGLSGLVKTLGEELRGTGLLSMGVEPGSVDTRMLRQAGFPPRIRPEEVATVVRFLALEAPAAMQGSIVEVFG